MILATWTINWHSVWLVQAQAPKLLQLQHILDALDYIIGSCAEQLEDKMAAVCQGRMPTQKKVDYKLNT